MASVAALLAGARVELASAGLKESAALDASLLLSQVLGCDRTHLYAQLDRSVGALQQQQFAQLVQQRTQGQPVAYLLGFKEFYRYTFAVGAGVLVPRPESELLVELALQLCSDAPHRILELCCGSGCIALSLALERQNWVVDASDISPSALHYAQTNCQQLGAHTALFQSDLFCQLPPQTYHLILANPPYLTTSEWLERQQQGWKEPREALDGGPTGLSICSRIIRAAPTWLEPAGWLLMEAAPPLMPALREQLQQQGWASIAVIADWAGHPRVVRAQKS